MRPARSTSKGLIRAAFAVLVATASACGSMAPRPPMSDGERLYVQRCTSCHDAYEPHDFSPSEWRASVDEMERLKRIKLSMEERMLILHYLVGPSTIASR